MRYTCGMADTMTGIKTLCDHETHKVWMAFLESATRLTENIDRKDKRKVIDPLIISLALLLKRRFRAQKVAINSALKDLDHNFSGEPSAAPLSVTVALLAALSQSKSKATTQGKIQDAYEAGADYGSEQIGTDIVLTSGLGTRRTTDFLSGIDATTRKQVMDAINAAFAKGSTAVEFKSAMNSVLDDAIGTRADVIAVNQISDAFHTGMVDIADKFSADTGIAVKKVWVVDDDPCPICQDNADQGPIPDDEDFESGDDSPPAHPNCRCSIDLVTEND